MCIGVGICIEMASVDPERIWIAGLTCTDICLRLKRENSEIFTLTLHLFSNFTLTGLIYVKQIVPKVTALWLLFGITNGHVSFSFILNGISQYNRHKNMLNDSYFPQMVATVDIILTDPTLMPCDTNPTSSHVTRLISSGFFSQHSALCNYCGEPGLQ